MNLHSSTTRKPTVLSKRISLLGFTAVATAALMFSAESASATAAQATALKKALTAAGASTESATPAQLASAVSTVIKGNTKLAGSVVGEALKLNAVLNLNSADLVTFTNAAAALLGATPDAATLQKFVGDAAKSAATGAKPNASQVGAFASVLLSPTDAIATATIAKSSKTAVGAILGGLAGELTTDAEKITLVNTALGNKSLSAAVTEISRAVAAANVSDVAAFASNVAGTNSKLALKIAPAVVASNPTDARDITSSLLSNATLKPILTKGAAAYAKSVAAVADVEQISAVGSLIADQIGAGAIKTSVAAGLAKTLAQAIIAKPTTGAGNKADEIGEVAAYIVGGIVSNAGFTAKTAPKLVLAIIKSAIIGGKANAKQVKGGLGADASYIADVVGSVARTLANSTISSDVKTAIQTLLNKSTKSIAGASNATAVQGALTLGFDLTKTAEAKLAGYENGTKRSLADLAAIVDPETDNKNL